MSMDIQTPKGVSIVFTGGNGYDFEREMSRKVLTIGKHYVIENISISGWSSSVSLVGVDGVFNTVHFDNID